MNESTNTAGGVTTKHLDCSSHAKLSAAHANGVVQILSNGKRSTHVVELGEWIGGGASGGGGGGDWGDRSRVQAVK